MPGVETVPGFDPAQPFEVIESPGGKIAQSAKLAARGATAEGIYAGSEGAARLISKSPLKRGMEAVEDWWMEKVQGFPLTDEQKATRTKLRGDVEEQMGQAALDRTLEGYADQTRLLRDQIRTALPVDEAFAQSMQGQVAQAGGQAAGTLPAYAVPGVGPTISVGQIYSEAYDDARRSGADESTAHSAAMKYLPAAALDYLGDKFVIGRILKPLKGRAPVKVVRDAVASAAVEGGTEGTQQLYLNQVAKRLEGYDPERPFDQEVLDSMLVGALVGGGVTATGQGAAALAAPGSNISSASETVAPVDGVLAKPGAASPDFDPFAAGTAEPDSSSPVSPSVLSTLQSEPQRTAAPADPILRDTIDKALPAPSVLEPDLRAVRQKQLEETLEGAEVTPRAGLEKPSANPEDYIRFWQETGSQVDESMARFARDVVAAEQSQPSEGGRTAKSPQLSAQAQSMLARYGYEDSFTDLPSDFFGSSDQSGSFARRDPSMPAPSAWSDVKAGMNFDQVKHLMPKAAETPPAFVIAGPPARVYQRIRDWLELNPVVSDADGNRILLANTQGGGTDRLMNRAEHLAGEKSEGMGDNRPRIFSAAKARLVAAIPTTLQDYHAKLERGGSHLYFRRYADGLLHMVVTDPRGMVTTHGRVDGTLITQYAPKPNLRFEGAKLLNVRGIPAASGPKAGAGNVATPQGSPESQTGRNTSTPERTDTDIPPAGDVKPLPGDFRRERAASDRAQTARFAQQRQEHSAVVRNQLEEARQRWRTEADRIAPGLMRRFGLEFGHPKILVDQGKVKPEELTGYEQAYYDGNEQLLYLFDEALQGNKELYTRLNLLHEMGHAHWNTLPVRRQAELGQLWEKETAGRQGPLYDGRKQLRPGVAHGVEADIKEWYAERVAWANHEWAKARAGGRDAPIAGPIGRAAQELRILLGKLKAWVEQLRGNPVDVDFRTFLDQGDRFDHAGSSGLALAAAAERNSVRNTSGYARRVAPGEAHQPWTVAAAMRQAADNTKHWLRRELTSRGHLPEAVYAARVERDGRVTAIEKGMQFALRDLDAAVRAVHGGWTGVSPAEQQQLNDVLGGKAPVSGLDPRIQPPLEEMRRHVDNLSRRLVQEGAVAGDLAARISGNVGFYLHRSYRKFDDPKWAARVDPVVLNRASSFLRAEMRSDVLDDLADRDFRASRQLTPNAAVDRKDLAWLQARAVHDRNQSIQPDEAKVQGLVEHLLTKDLENVGAVFGGAGESKDLGVVTRRKEIAPEIRELLGEYKDPRVNYARSVAKMGQLLETHRFLVDTRRAGLGKFLFPEPRPGFAVRIAAEGSQAMAPLNGLYTSPEIYDAFKRTFDERAPQNPAWRAYLALNGWVKMAKTVLHPITQVRNFVANFGFLLANGHWHAADGGRAVLQGMRAELGGTDARARAYLTRLARYGVVGESAAAGEIREAMRAAGVNMTGIEQWTDSAITRAAKLPMRAAERLYRANDDIFKIYAFENEVRSWREALPAAPIEQVERIAAERVQNTLPTYSKVPLLVQRIRQAALLGTFVSFPAEIVRTGYHTLRYAYSDLRSNNPVVRRMGAARLAGIAAAASVWPAASLASRWLKNLDKDDEDDLRRFMPEWNKNAQLLYTGPNEEGKVSLVDLSYLDPWAYLRRPLAAAIRGENWVDSLGSAAAEAAAPFASEGVLAKQLLDVSRNRTADGRPVYDQTAGPIDQQLQKLVHVWQALEPGFLTQARRMVRAARGEVSASGRAYKFEDELLALSTGARSQSLDVGQAHHFQAGRFAGELGLATVAYRRVRDRTGADPEEIQQARANFEQVRARLSEQLHLDTAAAERLGVPTSLVFANLKAAGLSKAEIVTALTGQVFPYIDRPIDKSEMMRRQLQAERN